MNRRHLPQAAAAISSAPRCLGCTGCEWPCITEPTTPIHPTTKRWLLRHIEVPAAPVAASLALDGFNIARLP